MSTPGLSAPESLRFHRRVVRSLRRISAAIDRLNDRIGSAIQWLALVMVVIGAFNAIARYTDQ